MNARSEPVPVFVSYAHADRQLCDELSAALQPLEARGEIRLWLDQSLVLGDDYLETILRNLGAAKLVLLLVTERYLASSASQVEVEYALAKKETGQSRVIPIILEDCDWKDAPYAGLEALPPGATPLAQSADPSAMWTAIAEGVAEAAADLRQPMRDPELRLFSNANLIEMIEEVDTAMAVIRRAHNVTLGPDNRTLLELAQLEKRRDGYKTELAARIGSF